MVICANGVSQGRRAHIHEAFCRQHMCLDTKSFAGFLNGKTPEAIGVTWKLRNDGRTSMTYHSDYYVHVYYPRMANTFSLRHS